MMDLLFSLSQFFIKYYAILRCTLWYTVLIVRKFHNYSGLQEKVVIIYILFFVGVRGVCNSKSTI
jgi:hypothetical protein